MAQGMDDLRRPRAVHGMDHGARCRTHHYSAAQHRRLGSADCGFGTPPLHPSRTINGTPNGNSCNREVAHYNPCEKYAVWDCESSLYDSFELFTFSQQLNRAVGAVKTVSDDNQAVGHGIRSFSMPHGPIKEAIVDGRRHRCHDQKPEVGHPKMRHRFSRSLQKLFRVFHRPKAGAEKGTDIHGPGDADTDCEDDQYYVVYPDQHKPVFHSQFLTETDPVPPSRH